MQTLLKSEVSHLQRRSLSGDLDARKELHRIRNRKGLISTSVFQESAFCVCIEGLEQYNTSDFWQSEAYDFGVFIAMYPQIYHQFPGYQSGEGRGFGMNPGSGIGDFLYYGGDSGDNDNANLQGWEPVLCAK